MDQTRGSNVVKTGIDLSEFYLSVEWDILDVPATRNEEYYTPQRFQDNHDVSVKSYSLILIIIQYTSAGKALLYARRFLRTTSSG